VAGIKVSTTEWYLRKNCCLLREILKGIRTICIQDTDFFMITKSYMAEVHVFEGLRGWNETHWKEKLLLDRQKLNQSDYRPGQALRFPGVWSFQISRQSAPEGGKVVRPTHRPPLHPRKYSWYSFLLEVESTPETRCGRKNNVNEKFQWHHREPNPWPSGL